MTKIDQPSALPTRKWRFAGLAEAITAVVAVLAVGDIDVNNEDVASLIGGATVAVAIVGRVVAYFTRNEA
jgi:hypothetical protein